MPFFALVDCNNFYASCERVFNPRLEGKPVVVLSNNDGCIIARSYEAKKLGIPMGAPFFKWESICKKNKVQVFSSNYELYGDMSRRVMALLANHCPDIEIYSIDEAFLQFQDFNPLAINDYGSSIRQQIKLCTGIPVSIGIAKTKTLSKLANYVAKTSGSNGIFHIHSDNISILKDIRVDKVWGIGYRLAHQLNDLSIYTAEDLKNADPKRLRKKFSVMVEKIIYELRGVACLSLESIQPRKQIISSRSFGKKITLLSDLEEAVSHYAATAAIKLRKQHSLASGIGVFLHTNFFNQDGHYQNSMFLPFSLPTSDTAQIIKIAKHCIKQIYRKGYAYHKAGVVLSDLTADSILQMDLFSSSPAKRSALLTTIDAINKSYGKNAIFYCAEGIERSWKIKSAYSSPRYTTNWNDIVKVR